MLTLYGINNCDTIRKTRKWLQNQEVEYQFYDYKKQGLSPQLVSEFLEHFSYDELVNRRGTSWRNLTEQQKANLNRESAIEIMCATPAIVKRPLIQTDQSWLLGFNQDQLQSLIFK